MEVNTIILSNYNNVRKTVQNVSKQEQLIH